MKNSGKILIVDDDETFLESNRDLLEAFGYEVHVARNGTQGIEVAKRIRPDVMILDVIMATATEGFEVARRVSESPELKDMAILLVTGITHRFKLPVIPDPDDTWLPVDRVLEKPISPERLLAEIERLLKQRRTRKTGCTRASCLVFFAGLACTLTTVASLAGDAARVSTNRPYSMPPIVVTARGYPVQLTRTPGSIGIVERDELVSLQPVGVAEGLHQVAGVWHSSDGQWGGDVNIRGLGRNSVMFEIDGCRVNTATDIAGRFGLINPAQTERIEVLKGPISSLYGSGTIGGVVSVNSRSGRFSPAPEWRREGSVVWRDNPRGYSGHVEAGYNTPDAFAFATVALREHENYKDGEGREVRNSQFGDRSCLAHFGWKPVERLTTEVRLQYVEGRDIGIPGSGTAPLPVGADVTYPATRRGLVSVATAWHPDSEAWEESKINLYYQSIDRRVLIENFPVASLQESVRPGADHETYGCKWLNRFDVASQTVVAGVDAWQRDYVGWRVTRFRDGRTVEDKPLPDSRYFSGGVFLEDDWRVSSRWTINTGGRMDAIEVENDPTPRWAARTEQETSWDMHVGTTYQPAERLSLKGIAASGYRAASLEERYQYLVLGGGRVKLGNPDLKSERSEFFEAGLNWSGDRVTVTVSAYLNELRNRIGEEIRDDGTIVNANVDEARIWGSEVEVVWSVVEGLECRGLVAYVEGRDTGNDRYLADVAPCTVRVGTIWQNGKGFWARADLTSAARQDKVPEGVEETPGWTTVNLRAGKRFSVMGTDSELVLGVDNLFDETYRDHLTTYRGDFFNQPGRSVLVMCRAHW